MGWLMSLITDLLSIGMGSAGVLPVLSVVSRYLVRSVSIQVKAAYKAAALGHF